MNCTCLPRASSSRLHPVTKCHIAGMRPRTVHHTRARSQISLCQERTVFVLFSQVFSNSYSLASEIKQIPTAINQVSSSYLCPSARSLRGPIPEGRDLKKKKKRRSNLGLLSRRKSLCHHPEPEEIRMALTSETYINSLTNCRYILTRLWEDI